MLKSLLISSVLALASASFANAGGDPSPGPASENAVVLGTVSVGTANQAIASVGLSGAVTLTGTTATVTRAATGDISVTSDSGSTFTVSAGFVAQLILSYFN